MRKIHIILFLLFYVSLSYSGDYVVVVGKSSEHTAVSATVLKRLYTGRIKDIDGKKAVPVNLSLKTAAAAAFLKEVVGKSKTNYLSFWLAEQVREGTSAPVMKKTSEEMIEFLKNNPEAIGYVEEGKVTEDVKVLEVK